ncbi:hypothetical protein OW763_04285 [Clostridium aestuarii]|uniref:Uncharacterized protein n=1 Tax=Clostridium aestuarii TaxID=338193 RepID=A0ABT4CX54_9CLOT|nr:hypothetical protein [Clostridium aestuarii]MCY6483570.1 hypothetical protein [Clostridium aestuarii]
MAKLVYTNSKKTVVFKDKEISIDTYIDDIDIDREVFSYLEFLESQEIQGMKLEDFYLYDNITMYYFERHPIYEKLKRVFLCFLILENVIKNIDENIDVETDNEILFYISEKIFNLDTKKIVDENSVYKKRSSKIKLAFKLSLRIFKGIKGYLKFKINFKGRENFLSISNTMNINKVKLNGKDSVIDTQLGIVIDKLENKYNMFNIQCLFNFDLIDKSLKYEYDYIPFEFFVLNKKLNKSKYMDKKLIKNSLDKLSLLNFNYNEYDLKDVVFKYVFQDIKTRYINDIIEMSAARNLIRKHKIKKCIVVDEGDRPREFIVAANIENVKTYAVQHGIINSMSPAYIINSKYKDIIIPKYTFVWGKKYKRILVNNTNIYDDKNVIVVGQSRTDLLKQYNTQKQNKDRKIKILYATQYFRDLLESATEILFEALSLMDEDYEIVIKLHPADSYYEIYESFIKKYNIRNVRIVKDGDLYELISWCDVVVSVHSTVVVEGAMLNKPSVCILLPKYNDAGNFVRDGVSIGVKDKYSLKESLENIKEYKFDEKFKKYIEDNFYKVDGKVTNRIVKLINNTKDE